MSDFDKEKERERLREKYEQDKQKREATEKMSELLLQGATMTNAHCSECGDPIFRYDGQEFCATCEKPVDREGSDAEDSDESETSQGAIEVTSPSDDARVKFGGQSGDSSRSDGEQGPRERADTGESQPRETERTGQPQSRPSQSRESQSRERQPRQPQTREIPSIEPGEGGDVTAARESLVRTLQRFSEQAEATEDPQRAREHLSAAREAAETLAALRR
jgi:uncharacterized Zn finger protein (UPF0148 family)